MSVPAPTTQYLTPTLESGGDAHELWPQFGINDEQLKNLSHIEYPLFKKSRNSEIVPNPRMPVAQNKAMTCNFFKTRLCAKFRLGNCIYGDRCIFAHGIGDIRKPLLHWQGLVVEDRSVGIQDEELRLRLGMEWHEFIYLFSFSIAKSIATTGSSGGHRIGSDSTRRHRIWSDQLECKGPVNSSLNANHLNLKTVFWKTRLCNKWETTSDCPYGEKYFFAHGQAELQKLGTRTSLESGSVHVANSKTLPTPAKDASPSQTGIRTICKQQASPEEEVLIQVGRT